MGLLEIWFQRLEIRQSPIRPPFVDIDVVDHDSCRHGIRMEQQHSLKLPARFLEAAHNVSGESRIDNLRDPQRVQVLRSQQVFLGFLHPPLEDQDHPILLFGVSIRAVAQDRLKLLRSAFPVPLVLHRVHSQQCACRCRVWVEFERLSA